MKKITLFVVFGLIIGTSNAIAQRNNSSEMQKEIQLLRQKIEQLEQRVQELEQNMPQQEPKIPVIPCMEAAFDTETEYNELGMGEGPSQQIAYHMAVQEAKKNFFARIDALARILLNTTNTITESQKADIVDSMCNIRCRKISIEPTGMNKAYVAVSINKPSYIRK